MVNLSDMLVVLVAVIGFVRAQGDSRDLRACKRACHEQFYTDPTRCRRENSCKEMEFLPPNIDNYIPEAFSFLCYDGCDEKFGPFPVSIQAMERKENLVMTNISWDAEITAKTKQCLVTWEVYGGGLMGNLLTDCCIVELSLWPDTAYNVHVTCKNKNGKMRRSFDLFVDTSSAKRSSTTTSTSTTTDNNYIIEPTSKSHNRMSRKEETIVGTAISVMLFIAIAAIFVIYRSRRTPKTIEKEILIYKELGIVSPTTLHV